MYDYWPPYVSVGERRRRAAKEMERLAKKTGRAIQPVVIKGRAIATTFWGKAWCEHLEKFSDYANRLPRGRSYVRNGSVVHLEIDKGLVRAQVSGSSLYTITIEIQPIAAKAWEAIKKRCAGEIHSLLDLLAGKLSDGVMEVVTDRDAGLFPKPKEIAMKCSCPDWAVMCKHVAAVLYGVGARLDEKPELLFLLRGVDQGELVSAGVVEAVTAAVEGGRRRHLADTDLAEVFGIDMGETAGAAKGAKAAKATKRVAAPAGKDAATKAASEAGAAMPRYLTGRHIREFRDRLGLNQGEFAQLVGVLGGVISSWEHKPGILNLHAKSREALEKAWEAGLKRLAKAEKRRADSAARAATAAKATKTTKATKVAKTAKVARAAKTAKVAKSATAVKTPKSTIKAKAAKPKK